MAPSSQQIKESELNCTNCGFCKIGQGIIKTYVYKNGKLINIKEEKLCGR